MRAKARIMAVCRGIELDCKEPIPAMPMTNALLGAARGEAAERGCTPEEGAERAGRMAQEKEGAGG